MFATTRSIIQPIKILSGVFCNYEDRRITHTCLHARTHAALARPHPSFRSSLHPLSRHALEELCARAEGAQAAFTFTSGMAALAATLRLLKPGDSVIASEDIYGGMHRLLRHCASHSGLTVKFVPTWDLAEVERVLEETPRSRMVCVESPTNPMMRVRYAVHAFCAMQCLGL